MLSEHELRGEYRDKLRNGRLFDKRVLRQFPQSRALDSPHDVYDGADVAHYARTGGVEMARDGGVQILCGAEQQLGSTHCEEHCVGGVGTADIARRYA